MPELAEVETVCRVMRKALVGKRITRAEVAADSIVFGVHRPGEIEDALVGRVVRAIGRRGKTFWIELAGPGPTVYGHLGMTGWIRELGAKGTRLIAHGDAPLDDATGRPRFQKLLLVAGSKAIAFTDPRRLGRVWLGVDPEDEPRIKRLGRDAHDDLPTVAELLSVFSRRIIPIKALLLQQDVLAGIGNWLADEVLYQARISPKRVASSLSRPEVTALRRAITTVVAKAVDVGADYEKFPRTWLFEHRWGGSRGSQSIGGHKIRRDEVGGRTTAWVPTRQK